jgi:hypothetical protein
VKKKGRIGSSFDEFLKEDGLFEEVTARAIKRVTARRRQSNARTYRPRKRSATVRH